MSEFPPNIAPLDDGSGLSHESVRDAPEPAPITEQEVGEYREQDRYLPVRFNHAFPLLLKSPQSRTFYFSFYLQKKTYGDRKRSENHEI
jgi:hypothetical protein